MQSTSLSLGLYMFLKNERAHEHACWEQLFLFDGKQPENFSVNAWRNKGSLANGKSLKIERIIYGGGDRSIDVEIPSERELDDVAVKIAATEPTVRDDDLIVAINVKAWIEREGEKSSSSCLVS